MALRVIPLQLPRICFSCALLLSPLAAAAQTAPTAQRDFSQLFTRWGEANRASVQAEAQAAPAPAPQGGAVPASSPLFPQSRDESAALGERVGEVVRSGDCAEGERMAREAGDFALVRAVRAHCAAQPSNRSR